MHGRLKVKEKAEIEAEKKKRYQEKVARFKSGLDLCLKSKAKHDYSNEVMRVSFDLISINPDVYSIWNLRKESIMIKKKEYEKQLEQLITKIKQQNNQEQGTVEKSNEVGSNDCKIESNEDSKKDLIKDDKKESDEENKKNEQLIQKELSENELTNGFQKLCEDELELSECALYKNPKSYPAWQHRLFILSLIPRPNFKREFNLNEAYLQKDGRNFHCWHYRTNLCKISNRDLKDEMKFSLDRIKDDLSAFSYSTLYYRSLTLTKASNLGLIDFSKCWLDEYNLIENALFTEPSDQALWFYLKWLLVTNFGQCLSLGEHFFSESSLVKVIFNNETKLLIFYLDKVVKDFPYKKIDILLDEGLMNQIEKEDLKSVKYRPSKLWFVHLNEVKTLYEIHLKENSSNKNLIIKLNNLNNYQLWINDELNQTSNLQMRIHNDQLESLLTLKQLEPDNKWLNLILSYFENSDQLQILDHLIELDPLRTNYYKDQRSKIKLDKFISKLDLDQTSVDLSNLKLTVFYTPEPFGHLATLNLTGNRISFLNPNFNCLISLKNLILDDNLVDRIHKNFNLINLESLSLRNNKLTNRSGIENLANCSKLRVVYLFGNSLLMDDLMKLKNKGVNCDLQS